MFNLNCSVKLNNDQKFSLLNDGSGLLIRDIDQNDAGNYECVARSVVGETRSVARLTFNQNGGKNKIKNNIFSAI